MRAVALQTSRQRNQVGVVPIIKRFKDQECHKNFVTYDSVMLPW